MLVDSSFTVGSSTRSLARSLSLALTRFGFHGLQKPWNFLDSKDIRLIRVSTVLGWHPLNGIYRMASSILGLPKATQKVSTRKRVNSQHHFF